jgi:hypothetical protein
MHTTMLCHNSSSACPDAVIQKRKDSPTKAAKLNISMNIQQSTSVEACVAAHTAKLAAAGRVKALVLVHVLFQNGLAQYALSLLEQQNKLNYLSRLPPAKLAAILTQQPPEQALDRAFEQEQGGQQAQQQTQPQNSQDSLDQSRRLQLDQQLGHSKQDRQQAKHLHKLHTAEASHHQEQQEHQQEQQQQQQEQHQQQQQQKQKKQQECRQGPCQKRAASAELECCSLSSDRQGCTDAAGNVIMPCVVPMLSRRHDFNPEQASSTTEATNSSTVKQPASSVAPALYSTPVYVEEVNSLVAAADAVAADGAELAAAAAAAGQEVWHALVNAAQTAASAVTGMLSAEASQLAASATELGSIAAAAAQAAAAAAAGLGPAQRTPEQRLEGRMTQLAEQLAAASEWARRQVQQSSPKHGKQGLMAAAHAAAAAAAAGLSAASPTAPSSSSTSERNSPENYFGTGHSNGSSSDMDISSNTVSSSRVAKAGRRPGSGQRPSSAGASRLWQAAKRDVCKNSSTPGLRCRQTAGAAGSKSMW